MEKLKKFFGDSKGLVMNFRINIFMGILNAFIIPIIVHKGIKQEMFNTQFLNILLFILLYIALYISYKNHESNVQKSLISSLFTLFIINQIYEMKNFVNAILFIVIYVIHLSIMSNKKASITALKYYYILILFGFVFEIVHAIIVKEAPSLLTTIPSMSLLVSIDTRIYMYKEQRAKLMSEGNWNEKTKAETKKIFDI